MQHIPVSARAKAPSLRTAFPIQSFITAVVIPSPEHFPFV